MNPLRSGRRKRHIENCWNPPTPSDGHANDPIPRPRLRRIEYALLYLALPLAVGFWVPGRLFLPVLWITALPAALALRNQPAPPRRRPWRHIFAGIGARVLLAGGLLTLSLWFWRPEWLLRFPRRDPWLWGMVMLFYPLISVLPQGILYRALYYRRYAGCWRRGWPPRLMAALAFCLMHLVFMNVWALIWTFPAGWILARTYEHSGALWVSNLEHAAYGLLVFTIGWGPMLYHGTQTMLEHAG